MDDPQRAERLWLALAVATIWLVSVGGQVDAQRDARPLNDRPPLSDTPEPTRITTSSDPDAKATPTTLQTGEVQAQGTRSPRHLSCFRQGF